MGPDQRRTLTEAKSEFGKRAPFRALVIRTMMRDNNMEAQDAGQGAQQSRPYRMDMDDLGTPDPCVKYGNKGRDRSEEHTSELQSLMRISYAVFCLKKKKHTSTYKTMSISTI